MASTAVPFDPNYRVVMAAKVQGTTSDVAPLLVDSVTGRLLVDVSISGAALQDGVDTAIKATIFDYTNSNPLAVVLRDTNGDYVSVGGGTQYDEDTVSTAADKITMAGVVRRDTASTLAGTDGDRTQLIVDANGLLHINVGVSVLPTGASTAAHQVTQNGYLDGIEGLLSTENTNSAAIAASASVLDDWDESDRAKVNTIVGQAGVAAGAGAVGVTVQRMTLASDDPAVTRIEANVDSSTMWADGVEVTVKRAIVDAATSGNNTLLASVSSKKIRVLSLYLVSAGTVNVRFESGADGTALSGQMNLIANSGFTLPYNPRGWFETAATTLLNLELSAAISVDGGFTYIEV